MRKKVLSFTITDEMGGLDAAITAFAKEWILDVAVDVPQRKRSIASLSKIARYDRWKMGRWIDALGLRDEISDL